VAYQPFAFVVAAHGNRTRWGPCIDASDAVSEL